MRIKGRPQVDNVGWERATGGIVRVMAAVDRHSWSLLRGRFSACAIPKSEKCHPCSRLTLLPMFPVAPSVERTGSIALRGWDKLLP